MTPKPSMKRNAIANFLGSALPMIVSLVTVPLYLAHIGAARYGVLAIVWMLQGYFGYFDLGLSAATSNRIAQLSKSSAAERESVLWTALVLNAGFGVLGGLLLFAVGRLLFQQFHIAPGIHEEVIAALPWIACSVPLATISGVFAGALTGREQFASLNAVQFAGMLIFQIVPLLSAIIFKPDLQYVISAAILGSAASLLLMAVVVCRMFPLSFAAGPRRAFVKPLFSYGAWVTVTNLASPLLETADRLLIGSVLGPQAVAWYQVPFNLAVRVRILPGVLTRTLFPRLSALGIQDATELSTRAVRGLAAVMTPLIVFGIFLMQPFLELWTGHAFAVRAMSVGEAILLGVWINSLASIPYSHLQAIGRPDIVARFHALELLPFIALLWWTVHRFGLLGAALAWSTRCAVDAILLFWAARFGSQLTQNLLAPALLVSAAFAATLLFPWPSLAGIAAWIVLCGAALGWAMRAEPAARARIQRALSSILQYRWRRA
ncbi:Membrane protein involved in the export of O-antigen and teichoic acid [Paraburkholderia phenazinium]|uniref:Membrane protein involved in the export of O-antigen and teichoic acid n=2 Tax=Paraburkholderia phenazinium TaxID=60549 RepID=A0A1G8ER17_9BURK|nr:flippase [Paraburkholderia phenazinium]SDH72179.1 Membrane protein involved in the export of O-antigen and teichoic acid [Paraburkholderia phenazinium]